MDPLSLAMAGSSIFSGVGGAIDSGKSAGQSGDLSAMRSKEWIGGVLVMGAGVAVSFAQKAVWPLLIAAGALLLLVALHEYHARTNLPPPDPSTQIGPFK